MVFLKARGTKTNSVMAIILARNTSTKKLYSALEEKNDTASKRNDFCGQNKMGENNTMYKKNLEQ
jgi:hypothetical protein